MADGYYLNEDDVTVLRQMAAAWKRGEFRAAAGEGLPPVSERPNVLFGVADTAINGTTGTLTAPGSGTLNVYKFTSTGGTTATTVSTTVYNMSSISRTTSEYTIAVRDYRSGNWMAVAGSGDEGYKKICRFITNGAFSTTDSAVGGMITTQYGPGISHTTSGGVTLTNTETATAGTYIFSSTAAAAGVAYHISGGNWIIMQLQCPVT